VRAASICASTAGSDRCEDQEYPRNFVIVRVCPGARAVVSVNRARSGVADDLDLRLGRAVDDVVHAGTDAQAAVAGAVHEDGA